MPTRITCLRICALAALVVPGCWSSSSISLDESPDNGADSDADGDTDSDTDDDTDSDSETFEECSVNLGWPCTCETEECDDGNQCVGLYCYDEECQDYEAGPVGYDDGPQQGICSPHFYISQGPSCPATAYAAQPACALETGYGDEECGCILVGCTGDSDCPPGQQCQPFDDQQACRP